MINSKKYFFALLFFFSLFGLRAQFSGYTFCDWDKITFDAKYIPSNEDTAIVFVSVRNYFPGKAEFLDDDFDSTHALHYFTIYFNHNKWVCVPRQNLEDAFVGMPKNKDIVVYGEGMGKEFTGNVDRATRLTRLYNVVTLMFDWPTYRPYLTGGKNYKLARIQSTEVSKSMCGFFIDLEKIKPKIKTDSTILTILFHSLGNRLIKEAVTNNFITVKEKLFDNVVLNAACVKMRGHKKWLEKLNIQNKIYVTRNNHDRTLNLARLAAFSKRLGMHNRWRKANNAIYLNFSEVLKHEHNYFLLTNVLVEHPDLKKIYYSIFHSKNVLFNDEKKFRIRKNGRIITLKKPFESQNASIGINLGI